LDDGICFVFWTIFKVLTDVGWRMLFQWIALVIGGFGFYLRMVDLIRRMIILSYRPLLQNLKFIVERGHWFEAFAVQVLLWFFWVLLFQCGIIAVRVVSV